MCAFLCSVIFLVIKHLLSECLLYQAAWESMQSVGGLSTQRTTDLHLNWTIGSSLLGCDGAPSCSACPSCQIRMSRTVFLTPSRTHPLPFPFSLCVQGIAGGIGKHRGLSENTPVPKCTSAHGSCMCVQKSLCCTLRVNRAP